MGVSSGKSPGTGEIELPKEIWDSIDEGLLEIGKELAAERSRKSAAAASKKSLPGKPPATETK